MTITINSEFIYCSKCGTRNFSTDKLCGVCNTKLSTSKVSTSTPSDKKPLNISLTGWVVLIIAAFVCYTIFTDGNKKNTDTQQIVFNNSLDASVSQVEDYLKNNLNDPSSYSPVSWSEVFKLNDTKESGFACYQVRHKYRAKNAFGAMVLEEKLFKLDYKGEIVDVRDFIR